MRTVWSVVMVFALGVGVQAAPQSKINVDREGLAVDGYDVVSYLTDGAPAAGNASFEATWNGARWRFSSAAHRDMFLKDPGRYAPQFGGYCAWAVSRGYTAEADPLAWSVVDGRLYLNYSKRVQEKWSADIPGNIAKARANWPSVLEK